MKNVYTVPWRGEITAENDLIVIAAGNATGLRKLKLANLSEFADAQEEMIHLQVMVATDSDQDGVPVTPAKTRPTDEDATALVTVNNPTLATGLSVLEELGWNNRNSPYEFRWPEGSRWATNFDLLVIRHSAPADAYTLALTAEIEEELT